MRGLICNRAGGGGMSPGVGGCTGPMLAGAGGGGGGVGMTPVLSSSMLTTSCSDSRAAASASAAALAAAAAFLASTMYLSIPPPTSLSLVERISRTPPSLPRTGPRFSSISMTMGKYPLTISLGFSMPVDILK